MSRPPHLSNRDPSKIVVGIILVLLSAVGLATQNVISRLFFVPGSLFDYFTLGGWVDSKVSNIVMLLAIRMAVMAMLLAAASPLLYSRTFSAIQQLTKDFKLLGYTVSSGLCLFFGLTSLYFALSQIAAGIAIAAFFIYPAITVLLAWKLLQQRPQPYQLSLMAVIFLGVALTTLGAANQTTASGNSSSGILCALLAGLSFGLYGIFSELALQSNSSLHPVPFSLVTFVVVSSASSLSLLISATHQRRPHPMATCPNNDSRFRPHHRHRLRFEQLWHSLHRCITNRTNQRQHTSPHGPAGLDSATRIPSSFSKC